MDTIVLQLRVQEIIKGKRKVVRHEVQFVGEKLGSRTEYVHDEIRGMTETLYRTEEGALIVHVDLFSGRENEEGASFMGEVTVSELQSGGRFSLLGAQCGFA